MKNEVPILINGRESKIFYRESRSQKKASVKINTLEMITIIDELLQGCESDFMYSKGITTLHTLTSWDEPRLKIKRLSNKIIELRKIVPKSAILTFRDFSNSKDEWKYGVMKDDEVVTFLKNLKEQILSRLGSCNES